MHDPSTSLLHLALDGGASAEHKTCKTRQTTRTENTNLRYPDVFRPISRREQSITLQRRHRRDGHGRVREQVLQLRGHLWHRRRVGVAALV